MTYGSHLCSLLLQTKSSVKMLPGSKKLTNTVTELAGDEKEAFLDFRFRHAPLVAGEKKERQGTATASFLDSLYQDPARDV